MIPALPTELKDYFASLKHREKYTSLLLSDLKHSLYVKIDKITTEATNLLILLRNTIGLTDELDHLITKCTNTVKEIYNPDLAIKLKKL